MQSKHSIVIKNIVFNCYKASIANNSESWTLTETNEKIINRFNQNEKTSRSTTTEMTKDREHWGKKYDNEMSFLSKNLPDTV